MGSSKDFLIPVSSGILEKLINQTESACILKLIPILKLFPKDFKLLIIIASLIIIIRYLIRSEGSIVVKKF